MISQDNLQSLKKLRRTELSSAFTKVMSVRKGAGRKKGHWAGKCEREGRCLYGRVSGWKG